MDAEYVGIFGAIVYDRYDMAASNWLVNAARLKVVDFSVAYKFFSKGCVMDSRAGIGLDWQLYLRPFKNRLWAACAIVATVNFTIYILARWQDKEQCEYDAIRMLAFLGCFCYVLVKAYYDGALTMFFTTARTIEPKTIEVFCNMSGHFFKKKFRKPFKYDILGIDRLVPKVQAHPAKIQFWRAETGVCTQAGLCKVS